MTKKNIAIIGAGTGLTTAWALDNQKQFNVTVFEESDRIGGHIHSIDIKGATVEGGAEFIGPSSLYPHVHRLGNHESLTGVCLKISSHGSEKLTKDFSIK